MTTDDQYASPLQARNLATLLTALAGVAITASEQSTIAWLSGQEQPSIERLCSRHPPRAVIRRARGLDQTATPAAVPCMMCTAPTTQRVRGREGDRTGILCVDCQHHCDGNTVGDQ